MAELPILLAAVFEVINDDDIELDLMDEYAYPNGIGDFVVNQQLRLGPTPYVGITNYVQETVWRYPDVLFKQHFRMSRNAYNVLLGRYTLYLTTPNNTQFHNTALPPNVKLLLFLWTIGNQDSFRAIGDRFGMLKGDAHYIFLSTCALLTDHATDFITWPQRNEYRTISEEFRLPYTIGVLDGTLIKIAQPHANFAAYTCRKKYCAVTLQATCTKNLKFTSVSTGWPGSMHDARVYENSELGHTLREKLAGTDYHIIADLAYPLSDCLLKSYPRAGASEEELLFNRTLNGDRAAIERAFGHFKMKFRRFKFLHMLRLDLVPSVIIAGCCLHNFIIDLDGLEEDDDDGNDVDDGDDEEEGDLFLDNEPLL